MNSICEVQMLPTNKSSKEIEEELQDALIDINIALYKTSIDSNLQKLSSISEILPNGKKGAEQIEEELHDASIDITFCKKNKNNENEYVKILEEVPTVLLLDSQDSCCSISICKTNASSGIEILLEGIHCEEELEVLSYDLVASNKVKDRKKEHVNDINLISIDLNSHSSSDHGFEIISSNKFEVLSTGLDFEDGEEIEDWDAHNKNINEKNVTVRSFKENQAELDLNESICSFSNTETKLPSIVKNSGNVEDKMSLIDELRVIRTHLRHSLHPSYYNMSVDEAEEYMANMLPGEFIIRPCCKGLSFLTISWKVAHKTYEHIDIKMDASKECYICIDDEKFKDLDAVIDRYITSTTENAHTILDSEFDKDEYEREVSCIKRDYLI